MAALASIALAACGSSSNNSSTATGQPASSDKTSTTATAPTITEPPAHISLTTPLSKRPPTGKALAFAACNIPACLQYVDGTRAATKALGWKFLVIPYKSGVPNPAVQQAVNAGADYIIISGVSSALYKNALASANAKG